MEIPFTPIRNNATGQLALTIANDSASLELQTQAQADLFPLAVAGEFWATLHLNEASPTVFEVVKATRSTGNAFVIERGQDGTSATDWPSDTVFSMYINRGKAEEWEDGIQQVQDNVEQVQENLDNSGISTIVSGEIPGGLINGSNTVFTTAAAYSPSSLKVYKDGIRLKKTADYTESASGFTMSVAPTIGQVLIVDYNTAIAIQVTGSVSFQYNEVPTGSVNGTNSVFTLARGYVAGSTMVFRDGQLMLPGSGNDYLETTPASGVITFVTAPVTGSTITVTYQSALSAVGNTDTLDGYHAETFLSSWRSFPNSLTFVSADTNIFVVSQVSGDFTTYIQPAMRIKINQSSDKFFIVHAVTALTLTLFGGTDYTLSVGTFASAYYSDKESPFGFNTSPEKWTVYLRDTTLRSVSATTANQVYNPGSLSIDTPIGVWKIDAEWCVGADRTVSSSDNDMYTALSTSSSAITDAELKSRFYMNVTGTNGSRHQINNFKRSKVITNTVKTTYYPVVMGTAIMNTLGLMNDSAALVVRALDAYL